MILGRLLTVALLLAGVAALALSSGEDEDTEVIPTVMSQWSKAVARVRDPNVSERRAAAVELERLAQSADFVEVVHETDSVPTLRQDLDLLAGVATQRGEDVAVRVDLIRLLAVFPFPEYSQDAIVRLIGVLGDEQDDPALRCAVIQWLAAHEAPSQYQDQVLSAATSAREEVREAVFRVVNRLDVSEETILALIDRGVDDPSPMVRRAAIVAASDFAVDGNAHALKLLHRVLTRPPELEELALKINIIEGIRRLGERALEFVPDLAEISKVSDPPSRALMGAALLDLTGDLNAYAPLLVEGLRSRDSRIWYPAMSALTNARARDAVAVTNVPGLVALLDDPSGRVRTRAAGVLGLMTNTLGPFATPFEPGRWTMGRDGRIHVTGESSPVVQVHSPPDAPKKTQPVVAAAALGIAGLSVSIWAGFRLHSRRGTHEQLVFAGLKSPRRIHLRPAEDTLWDDEAGLNASRAELARLGFQDVGPFIVAEVPAARLWALVRPEEAMIALLCEHRAYGRYLKFTTEYQGGTSLTLCTRALACRPSRLPGREVVLVPEADVSTVYQRMLTTRPRRPLRPVSAESFAADYERIHADSIDWKNSQGGISTSEIREFLTSRAVEASERQVTEIQQMLHQRALDELEQSLRERFFEQRSTLHADDKRRMADRLVVIHDGLSPANPIWDRLDRLPTMNLDQRENLSPVVSWSRTSSSRRAFAARNAQLEEAYRFAKVGDLDWPVAADFYLETSVRDPLRTSA